jgi:hypothetical protein
MKEILSQIAQSSANPMNLVREYLQARILESLERSGAMMPLAFQGGTALRFLYGIPRFSEDLDFTLELPGPEYDFRAYAAGVQVAFAAEGYDVRTKVNDHKTVHSAMVRFPGLLYELKLSNQPRTGLAIKIEVDTHPPVGAGLEVSLVRRYITLRLQHHDRASLLSGKLHAFLERKYTKGRDLYDLMWYLADPTWPEPNLPMLTAALAQTGWSGPIPTPENWRHLVHDRLLKTDWQSAIRDVAPFLERPQEVELLTLPNLTKLLRIQD